MAPTAPRGARRQTLLGLAFASPFLIGAAVFIVWPVVASAVYSFTDFNLFQPPSWVGLDNYAQMMRDDTFWKALANTLFLAFLGVPLTILISIGGAHLLNLPVRGQPLYRALVYLPTIVPIVVGGYLWRWLLNTQYGFVNYFLGLLHLPQPEWLEQPQWGKPAIVLMCLWTIGGTMIIYLAAIKDVPAELYEAAELDGAGWFARFRYVTWPTISPVTLFQIIVTVIAYLQIFTQPYLLTQTRLNEASGGPGQSMISYAMYLYQNAFVFLKMGYASAMAWVLFLLTLAITLVLLWSSKKWVHYGSDRD
ncbi:carbohydrate ABC transporter membrane protein 1 (CUT1 family) [Microbacterium sp. AG790]|uniref:carbohydrate ABC transporter permease n=1 Tax=Microbacterium sp. AG790 TaxID=2183995 RepID=UPI000F2BEF8D|nr:sugar ABC transporter permease [Microbacterium sp. AG790]RKS93200.1 carbohydrate ABC transporter membrane protein 1 (CUT1 family) [Microbacterium sp. AG790]